MNVWIIIADNQMQYEDYSEWIESVYDNYSKANNFVLDLNLYMQGIRMGCHKESLLFNELSIKSQEFVKKYNREEENVLRFRIETYILKE